MGIPSYYRKLLRSCPHLVVSERPNASGPVEWFFMDYNCLIYHCLSRPDAPVYVADSEEAWLSTFIASVVDYTVHVIQQVRPLKGVYLAIDGVVPMAKMRQQRLRRFTSAWRTKQGMGRDGEAVDGARWDTNAITPGTVFMDRLYEALMARVTLEGKTGVWRISSCREPGEGEHKIMAEWRRMVGQGAVGSVGAVAIYGLDADLIVLSLLNRELLAHGADVWLFRERMERGVVQYDLFQQESYEWFSVGELRRWLVEPYQSDASEFVVQYTCMMSVLGNDFLPSSLSYKMRDDGHMVLMEMLHDLFKNGIRLVRDGQIVWEGFQALFRRMASEEEGRVLQMIRKKQRMAEEAVEAKVGDENWPLAVMEEKVLLWQMVEKQGDQKQGDQKQGGRSGWVRLDRDWKKRYVGFFHGFPVELSSIERFCREYLYGVQWVWAYYTGSDVCFEWSYPFSLPPLWSWLAETKGLPPFEGTVVLRASDIQPVEQLAVVLPLESWKYIPPSPLRSLPYRAPHLFPSEFTFDSVGKRYFWECECQIPIPTVRMIRAWCDTL